MAEDRFPTTEPLRFGVFEIDPTTHELRKHGVRITAGELEVSLDGQWVVYSTYPDSNLWRSKLDGGERLQLTFAPINAHEPRWSPDGKQIVFTDVPRRLFIVSADGGRPRQVMPKGEFPNTEVGVGCWMR